MKKYILFGAGDFGQMALEDYGADNVACFADNNPDKQGRLVCGKPVVGFEELRRMAEDYRIVISVYNPRPIAAQLEESGIFDYQQYFPVRRKLAGRLAEELAGKTPRGAPVFRALLICGLPAARVGAGNACATIAGKPLRVRTRRPRP